MCGIFGMIAGANSRFHSADFNSIIDRLFLLSEARGKDASGLMLLSEAELTVLKRPLRAKKFIGTNIYKSEIKKFSCLNKKPGETNGFMGHARMVTNGSEETHDNNQPVVRHDMCMLHNGIIINDAALWQEFSAIKRNYEVDTEVALSLVDHFRNGGQSFLRAFQSAFALLQGANTVALVSADTDALILATSNGSLYFATSADFCEIVFTSEKYFLEQALQDPKLKSFFADAKVMHVKPGEGYYFSFKKLTPNRFDINGMDLPWEDSDLRAISRSLKDIRPSQEPARTTYSYLDTSNILENDKFISRINDIVANLRRCTKCILPETFPFIDFDEYGVCNYCRSYKPLYFKGKAALNAIVDYYRRTDGSPDCLVPISGGRDSCYGLHYIKEVLHLNPVAYTYDWGMVTDLARRNISRLCGALGVEHILLSADIRTKRKYIRQNVLAWLKRPALGMVPLFMAGDKQYFYYAQKLKEQMGIDIIIYNMNRLERTDFKVAFCGVDERKSKQEIHYALTLTNQLKMVGYYAKEYIFNPAYLNSSLLDTAFAFFAFYQIPKKYETLFDYIPWDEEEVNDVLINKYGWETASDTTSTWRIGDGTASFYNYIYYTMSGFSEHDTFRSNQIREGLITRDEALRIANRDNQPRYDSIQWYCQTIGVDVQAALNSINKAPKLYPW
ncbi:MAG: hypothetical protein OHK003_19600 [Anaerolineales bacterium]